MEMTCPSILKFGNEPGSNERKCAIRFKTVTIYIHKKQEFCSGQFISLVVAGMTILRTPTVTMLALPIKQHSLYYREKKRTQAKKRTGIIDFT